MQGLLILGALVPQLLNAALVGPAAAHIKEERARREANEGKPCTAANVSAARWGQEGEGTSARPRQARALALDAETRPSPREKRVEF